MKKVVTLVFSIIFSALISCSGDEDKRIKDKLPIKIEVIDYYTTRELTESSIYFRHSYEYTYDDENKLIEERSMSDGDYSGYKKFIYEDNKIIEIKKYNRDNTWVESDFFEYEDDKIVKITNKASYWFHNGEIITETYNYSYDSNSNLVKEVKEGKNPYIINYQNLTDKTYKKIFDDGTTTIVKLDNKKPPFFNVKGFENILNTYRDQVVIWEKRINNDGSESFISNSINKYDYSNFIIKSTSTHELGKGHTYVTNYTYNK